MATKTKRGRRVIRQKQSTLGFTRALYFKNDNHTRRYHLEYKMKKQLLLRLFVSIITFYQLSCDIHLTQKSMRQPTETPYNQVKEKEDCNLLGEQACRSKNYLCKWNVDSCQPLLSTKLPILPMNLQEVKQLKADMYVCGIDKKDELWCLHEYDHLNIYPHLSRHFKEVETQAFRVCGVLSDGSGLCFTEGEEDEGFQFTKKLSKLYPFGQNTCGIYEDGTVFCYGVSPNIHQINSLTTVVPKKATDLVINHDFRLGVLFENGQFLGTYFINNQWKAIGLISNISTASTAVSQITEKRPDACIIFKNTEQLACIGLNYDGKEVKIPTDLKNQRFTSVSVGKNHTCAILERNNQARCWGGNSRGQAKLPNDITEIKSIVAGEDITCYIDNADKPHCIGRAKAN
jgi:hypothetical protein